MKIYAVQLLTGHEDLVAEQIQNLEHPKIGKVYNLKNAFGGSMFPGYLFVDMVLDGDTYRKILDLPWVIRYLCPTSGVHPVTESEASKISEHVEPLIETGVFVRLVSGPMAGLSGKVSALKFPRLKIKVVVFGEEIEIESHIKHIDIPGLRTGLN